MSGKSKTAVQDKLSKAVIANALAEMLDTTKVFAKAAVDAVFETMRAGLLGGGGVYIPEIGTFTIKTKKERTMFIPSKGRVETVPARPVVKFTVAEGLRAKVAGEESN